MRLFSTTTSTSAAKTKKSSEPNKMLLDSEKNLLLLGYPSFNKSKETLDVKTKIFGTQIELPRSTTSHADTRHKNRGPS